MLNRGGTSYEITTYLGDTVLIIFYSAEINGDKTAYIYNGVQYVKYRELAIKEYKKYCSVIVGGADDGKLTPACGSSSSTLAPAAALPGSTPSAEARLSMQYGNYLINAENGYM